MDGIGKFSLPVGKNDRLLDMKMILIATMASVWVMLVVKPELNSDVLAQMFASFALLNVDVDITLMVLLQ